MRILFLSTWFPYPLSQGSKIRAYYLLRALAAQHEVQLVSFADAPLEPAWLAHLAQFCRQVDVVERAPFTYDRLRRLLGYASATPSHVVAGYSQAMNARVQQAAASFKPERVIALTFVTAPYALAVSCVRRILDLDNLMSRWLYEMYRQASSAVQKARRGLAWLKMRHYERGLIRQFDLSLVTSQQDQSVACTLAAKGADSIGLVPNGVDTAYNQPGLARPESNTLVFNGSIAYSPNYDAMRYFLSEIFPLVTQQVPEAQLRITGATTEAQKQSLPANRNVVFTGYLPDVRATVAGSTACVVPLRSGAGTRVKILEAMALGTPVVATSKGAEGLAIKPEVDILIADEPQQFAAQLVRLLRDAALNRRLASNARRLVEEHYDWRAIGRQFNAFVEERVHARRISRC